MRSRRTWHLTLLGVIVALVLAACGGDDNDAAPGTDTGSETAAAEDVGPVRVAIGSWPGFGTLFIAKEQGFFEEEGLNDVRLELFEDQSQRLTAMQAGRIDASGGTIDTWARAVAQGVRAKQIYATDLSDGGDGIVAVEEIQSVADLRGQRVAVARGSTAQFLLAYVLNEENLALDDIEQVDMNPAEAGSAFAAGRVPAASTWQPWLSRAEELEGGHVLADTREYPVVVTTIAFTTQFIEEHPEAVAAFVRAVDKGAQFLETNPDEAIEIIARSTDAEVDTVRAQIEEEMQILGVDDNQELFGSADDPGRMYEIWDVAGETWQGTGEIDSKPAPEDGIDPSFVSEGS